MNAVPVQITDWHLALVRGFLRQDDAKIAPMLQAVPQNEVEGTGVLMYAAFAEAVHRRFTGRPRADIIRFVADSRVRRGRNAPPVNPTIAERLIIAALSGSPVHGLTELQRAQHIILLSELVEDEAFTDAQLDAFLGVARTHAERIAAGL